MSGRLLPNLKIDIPPSVLVGQMTGVVTPVWVKLAVAIWCLYIGRALTNKMAGVSVPPLPETAKPEIQLADAEAKLQATRESAEKRFGRPGKARGVANCPQRGVPLSGISCSDPRLIDYIYEVVFSTAAAAPAEGLGGREPGLDAIRKLIFTLPNFKTAAERVAHGEDLLTRAVSLLEGLTRCRLCGSNNTTSAPLQMHSSDEAPTMMIYCGSCNHRTNQTGE